MPSTMLNESFYHEQLRALFCKGGFCMMQFVKMCESLYHWQLRAFCKWGSFIKTPFIKLCGSL